MGILALLAVLAATPSKASTRHAEALTQRAIIEYDGGEFDAALADAKKAYAIQPAAGLLYNLGQIHRALRHWEEAVFSYRAYLREVPDAPNRAQVEKLLAEVQKRLAEQNAAARPPSPPQPAPEAPAAPAVAAHVVPTKPRVSHIAVLDVQPHAGIAIELAQGLTALVVHDVRKQALGTSVVGADEIRAMVGLEHQKQLLGCTEASCLAEIGGALGAERLVLSSLSRFGDTYVLDLKLVDSRTAKVLADGSARVEQEGALPDAVSQCLEELFPKAKAATVETSATATARPGKSHVATIVLAAVAVVGLAGAIIGAVEYFGFQDGKAWALSNSGPRTSYQSDVSTSNAFGYVGLGGVVLAAAGGVGAGFTW